MNKSHLCEDIQYNYVKFNYIQILGKVYNYYLNVTHEWIYK